MKGRAAFWFFIMGAIYAVSVLIIPEEKTALFATLFLWNYLGILYRIEEIVSDSPPRLIAKYSRPSYSDLTFLISWVSAAFIAFIAPIWITVVNAMLLAFCLGILSIIEQKKPLLSRGWRRETD